MSYKLTRAADRKALADRLADHFARVEGVTVTNAPHEFDPCRICLEVSAEGARCFVDIDGDSTWGVLAGWGFGWTPAPGVESLRHGRLFTSSFQALVGGPGMHRRAHHKATGPAMGDLRRGCVISEEIADIFAATINRAMRNVVSGAAFEQERAA